MNDPLNRYEFKKWQLKSYTADIYLLSALIGSHLTLLSPQLGRYWSREERKRHLEKERERRRRHELLRRQQQQQPQPQPAQPQAPPVHLPHEEPVPPPPRPSTLENGLHQALWRDHSSRRKTSATLDASHRKLSSRKREVEEPSYGVRTPMVPLNPPPPPHQANQQMVKGLLSVTTV